MAKKSLFTMKVDPELRDRFMAEARALDRPASQIIREFMREFVVRRVAVREHDAWFRNEVNRALDDPQPGIPNDLVIAETRAIIDRIAAEKSGA